MKFTNLLDQAEKLAIRHHYSVEEDSWYNCPLSPEGCSDDRVDPNKCNCGVDKHNGEVKEVFDKLRMLCK